MSRKIVEAKVKVPEYPRARFVRKALSGVTPAFIDVTLNIVSIYLESTDKGDECALVRLDVNGGTVWRTVHPSQDEARWQAKHEFELVDSDWTPCS